MKVISIKKEQILFFLYALIIFFSLYGVHKSNETVETFSAPISKKVITIDAGHGGWDPGMLQGGIEEKNLNLSIALKLQKYLEQSGSVVLMTRAEDAALGERKKDDMRERVTIANEMKSDILVSVHQNYYPSESAKGAQVFYFENSEQSKDLADFIQKEFVSFLDTENKRETKESSTYYLLKKTKTPSVIVECGFLSNPSDLKNITNEEYQEKIAWAIYKGILNYFNTESDESSL